MGMIKKLEKEIAEAMRGGVCCCHWPIKINKNKQTVEYCSEKQKIYSEFCEKHTKEFLKGLK